MQKKISIHADRTACGHDDHRHAYRIIDANRSALQNTTPNILRCKVNLKSQATAHFDYGSDNEDKKPDLRIPSINYDKNWMSPMIKQFNTPVGQGKLFAQKYIQTFETLLCPSLAMTDDNRTDESSFDENANVGSSYMYYWRNPNRLVKRSQSLR